MVRGRGSDESSGQAAEEARPGRVLTVCTGNICRSPLLERLLQGELDRAWGRGRHEVTSAGTHALVGNPMDERAATVLRTLGGTPHGFVARWLVPPFVAQADLVLTATREHRSLVVRMHPQAVRYALTFREFAALADSVSDEELPGPDAPPVRLRALATLLTGRRGQVPVPELDIVDPYRRPDEVYQQMEEQVRAAWPSAARVLSRTVAV